MSSSGMLPALYLKTLPWELLHNTNAPQKLTLLSVRQMDKFPTITHAARKLTAIVLQDTNDENLI